MFLFHEIHVDDFLLEARRDRADYERSKALVEELCRVAEGQGQRLALRFRHPFAEAAWAFEGAANPVPGWEARGHEVGTHAHFRHVRRTKVAIDRLGVADNRCVVPGLIRADAARVRRVMRAARHLGFAWVTDQVHHRPFPYVGLTPWRPAADFAEPGDGPWVFIDVSVNPMAWGLLEGAHERAQQVIGLTSDQFDRLLGLLDHHLDMPRPHPVTHFGVPIHEHQFARALDDYRPNERSLRDFGDYLGRAARRPVVPGLPREVFEAWTAVEGRPEAPKQGRVEAALRRLDRRDLHIDGPSWLRDRLPQPGLRPRAARAWLGLRQRSPRTQTSGGRALTVEGPAGPVDVAVWEAPGARAQLVVSVAGRQGGRALGLSFLGLQPEDLVAQGWSVWLYDRGGTGRTAGTFPLDPGAGRHALEARAVFARARAEGPPVAWLSFSGGLIAALGSCAGPGDVQPFALVDAEAPADRLSLRPHPRGLERQALDLHALERGHMDEVAAPQPWEPFRGVAALTCPYHRLQAAVDHMHGPTVTHARALLSVAREPWLNGERWRGDPVLAWPGRLQDHGPRALAVLGGLLPGP